MSYSLEQIPNDATLFTPPTYTVWVRSTRWTYDPAKGDYDIAMSEPALGQIRHFDDLQKAKKRITNYASRYNDRTNFTTDWAIYKWNGTKYELIYDGLAGEARASNDLYKTRITKKHQPQRKKGIDYEVEAAVASILGVAS